MSEREILFEDAEFSLFVAVDVSDERGREIRRALDVALADLARLLEARFGELRIVHRPAS